MALVLALVLGMQEAGRVQELLQQLGDDVLETRELAQKSLIDLGDRILPLLKEARGKASGETLARIDEVLGQIDFAVRVREVYREAPRISLKLENRPLSVALAEIARQTGFKIDASAVDGAVPVSLDVQDEPILRVLDRLCENRPDCTHDSGGETEVRLLKEPHPSCPAAYVGPFRIRVSQIYGLRGTDFKGLKTSSVVTLLADWERPLHPSNSPAWDITRALDDRQNVLEIGRATASMQIIPGLGNGRIRLMPMGGLAPSSSNALSTFTLAGFDPAARRFSLEGNVVFAFPIDPRTVRFPNPGAEQQQELGDTIFTLRRINAGPLWHLVLQQARGAAAGWADSLPSRLPLDAVTFVDEDGAELTGRLIPLNASGRLALGGDGAPSVTYQVTLPRIPKPIREFKFQFVSRVHLKSVPFEIRDIPLP